MKIFLTGVLVILLTMLGMAVGVIFGRQSLRRCQGGRACELCADVREEKDTDGNGHGGVGDDRCETLLNRPPRPRIPTGQERREQTGSDPGLSPIIDKEFEYV